MNTISKRISLMSLGTLLCLGGCATPTHSGVVPLEAGVTAEQQIETRGLVQTLGTANGFDSFGATSKDQSFHTDIEFFETVLSYGQNSDPRVTFLLVNGYLVNHKQPQGIEFFERLLERYKHNMSDEDRATYLAGYAILRATHADDVSLIKRIGWVNDTFDILEEAKLLSGNENPLVRWASGLIYAQVPFFFFKKEQAYEELNWLAQNPHTEPTPGFYREAYHHLSKLHAKDNETELSTAYLNKSGYEEYEPKSLFMGWFTTSLEEGAAMSSAPTIDEIVEGRIFALYGFGFADIYFIVSADGNETIMVDAGARPERAEAAHKFILGRVPDLPPITTVIATHAHWDHIGGLPYLRSNNPNLKVYGRENYEGTKERVQRNHSNHQLRGADYDNNWVKSYKPDVEVSIRTEVTIAGTRIELIPAKGGETEDALLVNIPSLKTMFVGDILMPFYGEPTVEEGFIDEAVDTMEKVISRQPDHILHGHMPLTILYDLDQMKDFKIAYEWLVDATRKHVVNGYSRKDIVRLNLIPPGLENNDNIFLSYLAPREHLISRISDHMVGIWQEDISGKEPEGLFNVTSSEYGRLLDDYLGMSAGQVSNALERMILGGDNELAFQLAIAAEGRYPSSTKIKALKEKAGDNIRSSAQYFDPFKFSIVTEMMGQEHKPVLGDPAVHPDDEINSMQQDSKVPLAPF